MHGATAPNPFFKTCSTAGAVSHPPVHMYIGIYMQMNTHTHAYIYIHTYPCWSKNAYFQLNDTSLFSYLLI